MDDPLTVVYDANIPYPAPLRDLFIRLAQAGLVQAKWTNAIHDKWMRSVLKDRPDVSPQRLVRTKALMDSAVRDCLVSGHEALISSLALPDPDDCHVLAAAIHAEASVIITYNLKDFPADILLRYDIEASAPSGPPHSCDCQRLLAGCQRVIQISSAFTERLGFAKGQECRVLLFRRTWHSCPFVPTNQTYIGPKLPQPCRLG